MFARVLYANSRRSARETITRRCNACASYGNMLCFTEWRCIARSLSCVVTVGDKLMRMGNKRTNNWINKTIPWIQLRYHGTPKLPTFSKNTLLSFSDWYYSNLPFTKSFRKKNFLRKVMDEERLGPLISSIYVLTVICQQRRKYHVT